MLVTKNQGTSRKLFDIAHTRFSFLMKLKRHIQKFLIFCFRFLIMVILPIQKGVW